MARVTQEEVAAVLTSWDPRRDMTPWITAANLLVTRFSAPADGVTDELLFELERNLAAHLASAAIQPRVQALSNRTGSKTLPQLGMGLQSTPWGQAVMAMDPDGALTGACNNPRRRKATLTFLGNSPIEVTEWSL